MDSNHRFLHVTQGSWPLDHGTESVTGAWAAPRPREVGEVGIEPTDNHQILDLAALPICVLARPVADPGVAPGAPAHEARVSAGPSAQKESRESDLNRRRAAYETALATRLQSIPRTVTRGRVELPRPLWARGSEPRASAIPPPGRERVGQELNLQGPEGRPGYSRVGLPMPNRHIACTAGESRTRRITKV